MTATKEFDRPATAGDVARRAGVSRSTVSNILNGNDARFPESTRERVHSAARELNYRPSLAARSLVSGISDTIVVLLPNTTFGSNLQDAIDQVMQGTRHLGANVVVRFAGSTLESSFAAILALRPLALIDFAGLPLADRQLLEQRGTIIFPRRYSDEGRNIPDGGITEVQANALLERGDRPLWFASLSDNRLDPYGPGRFDALQAYCATAGLPEPGRIEVPLVLDGAIASLSSVLGSTTSPVGIACYNDDVALAILAAARELNVEVPDRLSVVGVDHTPVGQLWSPPLTTVDTDLRGLMDALTRDLQVRLSDSDAPELIAAPLRFTLIRGGTT
ncbi:LacI family DNA-binding transcriptional regulator [Arthrobacter sp. efr-133-TYG-118]|uniref:LacI family DNA-binding transcriptional regulator n=1 Tax=Arthrobacter sp. efr-133-TYG-118 TaxID=3040279 RepID=UPI00254F20CF|nr:LacI family DNA-binding transcriptional regulator [Arthrobacter sp. efr-133-TYG-118]